MNRQRLLEMVAGLLPIAELCPGVADVVKRRSLLIRFRYSVGKGKGFVVEGQRLWIIAGIRVDLTNVVEGMRESPLIVHLAKDFERVFEELKRALTVAQARVHSGDVVHVYRCIPCIIQ